MTRFDKTRRVTIDNEEMDLIILNRQGHCHGNRFSVIEKVVDPRNPVVTNAGVIFEYAYVYTELSISSSSGVGAVFMCRFIGENEIRKSCPWYEFHNEVTKDESDI